MRSWINWNVYKELHTLSEYQYLIWVLIKLFVSVMNVQLGIVITLSSNCNQTRLIYCICSNFCHQINSLKYSSQEYCSIVVFTNCDSGINTSHTYIFGMHNKQTFKPQIQFELHLLLLLAMKCTFISDRPPYAHGRTHACISWFCSVSFPMEYSDSVNV